jgi:UDP-N-acetylmuramoyl-L-alanyl-D-glutamate--2,6-diaminopimelate ligase
VVTVHRQLSILRAQGVRDVAMEVSSHALDQGRVDGVRFHSAVLTNLTRGHLDYHRSMQAYGEAKARLLSSTGLASSCRGDAFGRWLSLTAVWWGRGSGWLPIVLHAPTAWVDDGRAAGSGWPPSLGPLNAENAVKFSPACRLNCGLRGLSDTAPGRMEVISHWR